MNQKSKGFVVSAVLYPLLILFLALIMGLLAMTDTRKRILDKMKLEISDSIFDEATCSCDTILNKLNYLIKNGVGGGGGGSYSQNVLGLNVKTYESPVDIPSVENNSGDIAVITEVEMPDNNYYVSTTAPQSPKNGTIWIVQDINSPYYITSDYSKIGISYVMQYICDENNSNCEWQIKKAYVQDDAQWKLLYYVPVKDGIVDLTSSDINAEIVKTYSYTGKYQTFTAIFSGYYKIELWGAQGGSYNTTYSGGKGAYTSGEIYLNVGEKLYIYVGGTATTSTGGWNGGGECNHSSNCRGGGGSTDIRTIPTATFNAWNEFDSLKSRIMVAAGGGGSEYSDSSNYGFGGAAGGLIGYDGTGVGGGNSGGATQIRGGIPNRSSGAGGFGYGGAGTAWYNGNGAGGGGWYGGGGGYVHGGGGGSSYVSGYEGCSSIEEESTANNIIHNGSAYHYSGYYFNNIKFLSGKSTAVPSHDGNSTMVGNAGNGYAKVTLLTIEVKDKEEINSIKKIYANNYLFVGVTGQSGKYQIFTVPKSGTYKIELWGAQGGSYNTTYSGGKGAYTSGEIYLNAGEKFYIYVGGTATTATGGWNGGGECNNSSYCRGGGGSTDIRTIPTATFNAWNEFDSLKSRIMVAAGGGGSEYCNSSNYGFGGAAGGLIGYDGTGGGGGNSGGATQIRGGIPNRSSGAGGFGYGGAGTAWYNGNGAGGGGWYGGGGGYVHGGGGGSSYISGHAGCIAITSAGLPKAETYTTLADSISYKEYKFINTRIVDGQGYEWTTSKLSSIVGMPTIDGLSTMTGNSGDGYAKITYLGQ